MKVEESVSSLKDAIIEKYISHYYGEIKNGLFLNTSPHR